MELRTSWAMPNKNTFSIKPIREMIDKYVKDANVIVDPYSNSSRIGTIRNDIDKQYDTDYHLDATEFLKVLDDECADVVLYDPPYSLHQLKTVYNNIDGSVNTLDENDEYWNAQKKEIARITKKGGYVLTFSWSSYGLGHEYGFETEEILTVAHGSRHRDTIVVACRKVG